jgi:hypothetical protein
MCSRERVDVEPQYIHLPRGGNCDPTSIKTLASDILV